MIHLALHENACSCRDPVRLTLPASRWDILTAVARLGIQDIRDGEIVCEGFPAVPEARRCINVIQQREGFLDDLNYFARRVSELSAAERMLLGAAIAIHRPYDLKTMTDLTWHLDSIVMGNDGYKDINPTVAPRYDRAALPKEPDWVYRVKLCRADIPVEDAMIIPLTLPATREAIDEAFVDLGADTVDDIRILDCQCSIRALQDYGCDDIAILDNFAQMVHDLSDSDFIKFLALAEYEDVEHFYELGQVMQNMACYDFVPNGRIETHGSFGILARLDTAPAIALDAQMEPQMGEMA